MGYGVIGSPTGSGPVSLGSSPGTPATCKSATACGRQSRFIVFVTCGDVPARLVAAPAVAALQAGHPHEQQDHERSDDRAENARGAERVGLYGVVFHEVPQEPADERADDAYRDRAENADVVATWQQQAGHEPGDESDDEENYYESQHAVSATRFDDGHACAAGRAGQDGGRPAGWPRLTWGWDWAKRTGRVGWPASAVWRGPAGCANLSPGWDGTAARLGRVFQPFCGLAPVAARSRITRRIGVLGPVV